MNKILLSLLTISLVSVVAVGATRAYFSDTETSTGNSFIAGTLDLKINKPGDPPGDGNVTMLTVANTYPGASGSESISLKNDDSIAGYIDLHSITLLDEENSCNEAERADEPNCDSDTTGELSANLNVEMFIDSNGNGVKDAGEDVYTGLLSSISPLGYDSSILLDSTGAKNFIVNWSIPTGATNNIQSDRVTLGMTFELGQTQGQ